MLIGPEPKLANVVPGSDKLGSFEENSALVVGPVRVTRYCSRRSPRGASTSSFQPHPTRLRRVQLICRSPVGCTAAVRFTGCGGRSDSAEMVADAAGLFWTVTVEAR